MKDVSSGDGRTVLFVSHNMGSVRNLCQTGIVLKNGSIDYTGTANEAVEYYMQLDAYDEITYRKIDAKYRKPDMPMNVEFISVWYAAKKNTFASNRDVEFCLK